jgi:hypothetical protein
MKKCLFLCLAAGILLSACKKSDSNSSTNNNNNNNGNSNKLCSGNTADASYFPLKPGNTWTYASQNPMVATVGSSTISHKGNNYYTVTYTISNNTDHSIILRNDNQNNTLYYNAANDSEYAYVPAKPDTVYNWRFPIANGKFGRRKVTGVNVKVVTNSCSYYATEITQYDDKGIVQTKYYYVKGLGEVRETTFGPLDLSAVVLE